MPSKKDIKLYYKDLPEEKRTYAEKLVDRLFFMEKTLKRLEKEINERRRSTSPWRARHRNHITRRSKTTTRRRGC